jgi:hypothetical protein
MGNWWDWLDPFNAQNPLTLPLRAADWTVLQIPGVVGAAAEGVGNAIGFKNTVGADFARYEQNLNAGLGFTSGFNGPVNPWLSGNTNAVPTIDAARIGDAIGQTFQFGVQAIPKALDNLLPSWLLPAAFAVVAGGYLLSTERGAA